MDTRPHIGSSVITDMEANPDLENSLVIDRKMIGSRADVRSTDVPVDPEIALQLSRVTNEAITSVTIAASDGPKIISRSGGSKAYANNLGLNDPLNEEERAARLQERKDEICGALAEQIHSMMIHPRDNVRRGKLFGTPIGDTYVNELKEGSTMIDINLQKIGVPLRPVMDERLIDWIKNGLGQHLSAKLQLLDIDGGKPFADSTFVIESIADNFLNLRLIINRL